MDTNYAIVGKRTLLAPPVMAPHSGPFAVSVDHSPTWESDGLSQVRRRAAYPRYHKAAANKTVTSLIANDPSQNQFVDVSYFDQTLDGQRRNLIRFRYAIAKRSVFNSILLNGTHPGVRGLAPKHVGRKEMPCNFRHFCKETR